MRTFGYEAEFERNAGPALRALHDRGHAPTADMHRWHCDCGTCRFGGPGHLFRGQTDSSCSGEIISSVNYLRSGNDMANAYIQTRDGRVPSRDAWQALQDAAVEFDAEPGTRSGFHVHVGVDHLDEALKIKAVYNLCRWETLLYDLAAGSLPVGARSENQLYRNNHLIRAQELFDSHRRMNTRNGGRRETRDGIVYDTVDDYPLQRAEVTDLHTALYRVARDADRHSSLNLRTNHGTWEYRLWNSTRSAWRMEMFCHMSLALVEPDVILAMYERDDSDVNLDTFESIIREYNSDLAEMIARQRSLSVTTVPRFTQLVSS